MGLWRLRAIALVADSIEVTKDGDVLKQGPDNKIHVIESAAHRRSRRGWRWAGRTCHQSERRFGRRRHLAWVECQQESLLL